MTNRTRECPRCHQMFCPRGGRQVCAPCRSAEMNSPEHKAKMKVWQIVNTAIRDGNLVRLPCEVCGAARSDAHHDDYSKPLEVRWLCRAHHKEHHKRQQAA